MLSCCGLLRSIHLNTYMVTILERAFVIDPLAPGWVRAIEAGSLLSRRARFY